MYCNKCGAEIPNGSNVCPRCSELMPGKKYCQHCGQVIDAACAVCPKCGKSLSAGEERQQPIVINNTNTNQNSSFAYAGFGGRMRNKWVAFFLCLFLGFLGAHKFYEGKPIMGIIYLITFGLFGVGWIIDIVKIFLSQIHTMYDA